jgi:hypothetical protein
MHVWSVRNLAVSLKVWSGFCWLSIDADGSDVDCMLTCTEVQNLATDLPLLLEQLYLSAPIGVFT